MYEPGGGTQTVLATSRTLALRPSAAKRALSACAASFTEASSGSRGEIRLNLPAGTRAALRPMILEGASAGDRAVLVGTIRSRRGWVSVPVEIETSPVSASATELVVRPLGPVCLRSSAHRRLFDRSSHGLAEFFRMEIELAGLAASPRRAPVRTIGRAGARVSLPA